MNGAVKNRAAFLSASETRRAVKVDLSQSSSFSRPGFPRILLLLVAGWLAPGAGFFFLDRRHWLRGVVFIIVIHLTFLIGIALQGGLVWPSWTPRDPAFSVVNNLTLIMQLGAGWMAVLSLMAHMGTWPFFAAVESHALFELGSFYCMVAGGLNYFVVIQSLELSRKKAFELLAKE